MISDADLYRLAMFLGSCSMMMVVLYHFLEVNAQDDEPDQQTPVGHSAKVPGNGASIAAGASPVTVGGSSSVSGGGKAR